MPLEVRRDEAGRLALVPGLGDLDDFARLLKEFNASLDRLLEEG